VPIKPPFASQLTLEDELARFEALKPRMLQVWEAMMAKEDRPSTSVIVPSLTLDQEELQKLSGVSFYEERLLFLLIRLRNPRAHAVYVTSQPVHPLILDYYLHLLAGVPASHARARLTMLCAYDASPRSLTEKILERPRLIQRIRNAIHEPSGAYLTVFNATPLERRLAVLLGIPLNGLDPALTYLGTKSGSRKVFKEAGVACAPGFEDVKDEHELVDALGQLRQQRPAIRRAVVKLNDSFSGEGNAIFTYPQSNDRAAYYDRLWNVQFSVPTETPDKYFQKFRRMEGIVEEMIEAEEKTSPSSQFRTGPQGEVLLISTHDQILGGESGQVYLGCRFPAQDGYRQQITADGFEVGKVLAGEGVVSRYGVDFLAFRNGPGEPWRTVALEINLRVVGTTHPFLALKFLTGGDLDEHTGQFLSLSGRPKYYLATDNLRSEHYRGIIPEDLFDIVTLNGLHYSHRTESGVLFHMIGAVSEFGKLGLTAIANSPDETQALYQHALQVLDAETVIGR
jgi:hypothetical protein